MTIKNVCILILIISISFICGIIALAAGKMVALCIGLVLGGAAVLAAAFAIYFITKERSQKQQQEELKPIVRKKNLKNGNKRV